MSPPDGARWPSDRGSRPQAPTARPPQDLAAEQCVLGGMLLSARTPSPTSSRWSAAHDFYRPAHETDLRRDPRPLRPRRAGRRRHRRRRADPSAASSRRIGGPPYLHTLISSVPTAANAGYYAEIVRERAMLRRLVEAGTRIVQLGYAGRRRRRRRDRRPRPGRDLRRHRAAHRARTTSPLGDDHAGHARRDRGDRPAAAASMVGVPTGFADLDELTNGLHPGQMIVVAARPAIGKSTLGLDFARSAVDQARADQRRSSRLEMSRNEITMRLLSAEAKIALHAHAQGHDERRRLDQAGPHDGRGQRGAAVHRRQPEHDDDGDPGQVPPAQAAPRPQAGRSSTTCS